jgi:hypothetical protein
VPTTADGASWELIGLQLGWTLLAQAVGVVVCGAAVRGMRRNAPAPHAPSLPVLLRGPWEAAEPHAEFSIRLPHQARSAAPGTQRCAAPRLC